MGRLQGPRSPSARGRDSPNYPGQTTATNRRGLSVGRAEDLDELHVSRLATRTDYQPRCRLPAAGNPDELDQIRFGKNRRDVAESQRLGTARLVSQGDEQGADKQERVWHRGHGAIMP
jgi:hypothetical protein